MGTNHFPTRPQQGTYPPAVDDLRSASRERLRTFLEERLTEDLAQLWSRSEARDGIRTGPGLPAQVAVLDQLLTTVRDGLLPSRRELRLLLLGYGAHPDYDPAWTHLLMDGPSTR